MAIIYEKGADIHWRDVCEPVKGRIRNKAEVDKATVDAILSLSITSVKYLSHRTTLAGGVP